MAPRIWNPTINVSPNIRVAFGESKVTVYRDRKGDVYVRQYGEKLTPAEKRKGLSRARGRFAQSIKNFYTNPEHLGYKLRFTRPGGGIERTKNLMPATIDGRKGWFDVRNGKFLFKEQRARDENYKNAYGENFTQYGTMQLNMRSLDSSTYGLMQNGSLEEFYLSWLDSKEKARLNDALNDRDRLDWNEVYSHFESSDPDSSAPAGRPKPDEEKKGYDMVLRVIEDVVGDKWRAYLESLGGALR